MLSKEFTDFHDAWWYLEEHEIFNHPSKPYDIDNSYFQYVLDIQVVKVCPSTERIEQSDVLNTATRVWLECGPIDSDCGHVLATHDMTLDCGAPTFEEAIIKLANLVQKEYDNGKA